MMEPTLAARIRHALAVAVALLVAVACLVYGGDYARLRYKMARNQQPLGSVKVQHYYAVKLKDGKLEYYFDPPTTQACSYSLFPQMGYAPCWYLRRKANTGTNL